MKFIKTIAASLLFASSLAAAQSHVIVHVASVHTKAGYNNTNPGIGLRWADAHGDGPVAGVYRNSEWRNSAYAGYAWNWQVAGPVSAQFVVGAVTGYKRGTVVPLVMPSVAYAVGPKTAVRLSGVPPVGSIPGVVHLSFDYKF